LIRSSGVVNVGKGKFTYRVAEGWGQLPQGYEFGQVAGVATDSQGRVHLFNRSAHPVQVFDHSGKFLKSWGEGLFVNPHGITIGPDGSYWLVDRDAHLVQKYTPQGKLLLTLGNRNQASNTGYDPKERVVKRAAGPFNLPTKVALSPTGEIYVADGYGNCRVHKFSVSGELLLSWGTPGSGPGQFHLPHSLVVDNTGRVLVCDRENNRIQLFTTEGKYLTMWTGLKQPADIYIDPDNIVYVSELGDRVSILDMEGKLLARWGDERSHETGKFWGPHGIWVCARGDIYVSEVMEGKRVQKFVRTG
jgi:DNA-binding beta-propeller fold protein YncE